MPYSLTKTKSGYGVKSPSGMRSKDTSKKKAMAQMRLLQGIKHNPSFRQKVTSGRGR